MKKWAAFCTYIDSATFKLLCSLCALKKPEKLTLEQLQSKLDAQFGTKKLVLAEHYQFYNYRHYEGQSLTNYIPKLCHLMATCDWSEEQLEDNIRDKFVMGLRNECLLQQLLTQDHKKPLQDLIEFACAFEVAECESLKRMDSEKKEDNVAATAKFKLAAHSSGTRETWKPTNDFPVVAINSNFTPVLAVKENILEAAAVFAMSNARNAVNWGI